MASTKKTYFKPSGTTYVPSDVLFGTAKVAKIVLYNGTSHTTYQRQIDISQPQKISQGTDNIVWEYFYPSTNIAPGQIQAKLNSGSYVTVDSTANVGDSPTKTWTGLTSGTYTTTGYNVKQTAGFDMLASITSTSSTVTIASSLPEEPVINSILLYSSYLSNGIKKVKSKWTVTNQDSRDGTMYSRVSGESFQSKSVLGNATTAYYYSLSYYVSGSSIGVQAYFSTGGQDSTIDYKTWYISG